MRVVERPIKKNNPKPPRRPAWLYPIGTVVEHKGNYFRSSYYGGDWNAENGRQWIYLPDYIEERPNVSQIFKALEPTVIVH